VTGIALAGGADAANYSVANASVAATGSIAGKPLTVAANPDAKAYDGRAYAGGNGVAISGFIPGEDQSVLAGALRYGGTAQGASAAGTYRITPAGLDAANYALSFVDGLLTIRLLSPATAALGTAGLDAGYAAVQQQAANLATDADREAMRLALAPVGNDGRLTVAGCGIRMPDDMLSPPCPQAGADNRRAVQP
jgi:hypothetical protein